MVCLRGCKVDVHKPLMSGMSSAQMAISAMAAAFSIELLVLPGMFQHVRFLEAMSTQVRACRITPSVQAISWRLTMHRT
jgi:hypothetical protein